MKSRHEAGFAIHSLKAVRSNRRDSDSISFQVIVLPRDGFMRLGYLGRTMVTWPPPNSHEKQEEICDYLWKNIHL